VVKILDPPLKFERPPLWNGCSYEIKNYGIEVTFSGMTSILNFIKICQFISKCIGHIQREGEIRQEVDFISLTFFLYEGQQANKADDFTVLISFFL
jgi:hypothetical protein